jgi:hypothetical protein
VSASSVSCASNHPNQAASSDSSTACVSRGSKVVLTVGVLQGVCDGDEVVDIVIERESFVGVVTRERLLLELAPGKTRC